MDFFERRAFCFENKTKKHYFFEYNMCPYLLFLFNTESNKEKIYTLIFFPNCTDLLFLFNTENNKEKFYTLIFSQLYRFGV